MHNVSISHAEKHLAELIDEVQSGHQVLISKAGIPAAKLVPITQRNKIRFGVLKDKITISEDFDAPLPSDIQKYFED